jgi:DNA-directed RNA polymerase subunit RPC12/RpoP
MKQSYHCMSCDKDFIDKDMADDHKKSTGHSILERKLEK